MRLERLPTCEELDLGGLAGGARIKRWWHVQGNVPTTGRVNLGNSRPLRAPYRIAVDLLGVPRNYLARLTVGDAFLGSANSWCRRELQGICDWLVHTHHEELAHGGEVAPGVTPLEEVAPYAKLDRRSLLGMTSLLPGAEFYLLNHPGYSKSRWEAEQDCLEEVLPVSR